MNFEYKLIQTANATEKMVNSPREQGGNKYGKE